ncbi:MAG: hypothetical protein AAFR38_06835 [Planctomycetota bacterium]
MPQIVTPPKAEGDVQEPWLGREATRPGWPMPVGIVSICFGAIAVIASILGVASIFIFGGRVEGQLNGAPMPPSMQVTPMLIAATVLAALVNLFLVISGFALVMRKPGARGLHLAYALAMIPVTLFGTWYQMEVQSQMAVWASDYPDNEMARRFQASQQIGGGAIGLVIGLLLSFAWPAFCIIWFGMIKRTPEDVVGFEPDLAAELESQPA